MGKSGASHEKKSDKGTQSPMLKIFKEIMQREKASTKDPENANLLKEKKKKKKKRKLFSHNTSQQQEEDSSANEGPKIIQYDGRSSVHPIAPNESPTEKRESWLFIGQSSKHKARKKSSKDKEETCTCVSCALKSIVSNEYLCVAALCILFTLCVIGAFCVLFKTFPVVEVGEKQGQSMGSNHDQGLDSDVFKRKIEHLSDEVKEMDGAEFGRRTDRSVWDNKAPSPLNLFPRLDNDIGDLSLKSINAVQRSKALTEDLSKILATSKLNEITDNVKIRDFYKKLLYTDAQIKRLKRAFIRRDTGFYDRQKRSIFKRRHRFKTIKYRKRGNNGTTKEYEPTETNEYIIAVEKVRDDKKGRKRRQSNAKSSKEPSGIIFERKKLLVKFIKDDDIKFPKCSHATSHYDSRDHPYAQHTQKLDEILDKLLDQKIPEVMKESPISRIDNTIRDEEQTTRIVPQVSSKINRLETTTKRKTPAILTSTTRLNDKLTTPAKPTVPTNSALNLIYDTTAQVYKNYIKPGMSKAKSKIKAEILKMLNSPTSSTTQTTTLTTAVPKTMDKFDFDFREPAYRSYEKEARADTTFLPGYDLILSVSTLINPSEKRVTKFTANEILNKFPIRKLMQVDDEDDEAIGYEDFKEVLSDDMQAHDETDKSVGKRDLGQIIAQSQSLHLVPQTSMPDLEPHRIKPSPLDIHNPNWKGPMPLYQDELSSMIKNAVIHNTNKISVPFNAKDISSESGTVESEFNDVQYVEDYLSNKYDKLVKMAQAYSDYGVLIPKKEELRIEKNEIMNSQLDNRAKVANVTKLNFNDNLFKRSEQSSDSKDLKSNAAQKRERNPFKFIAKHLKRAKDVNHERDLGKIKQSSKSSDMDSIIFTRSTNKMKNKDFMIFNTRNKRQVGSETVDVENLQLDNNDTNSSFTGNDADIVHAYRIVPKRSLKSFDSDNVFEEVLPTDSFNITPYSTTFLQLNSTNSVSSTRNVSNENKIAMNETNDDLSDIDVTLVKNNKSVAKILDYNNVKAVYEINIMPLIQNRSVDGIIYYDYQEEYLESAYTDDISEFTTNNGTVTSTDSVKNIIGMIYDLNLDPTKGILNATAIVGDENMIYGIKSKTEDKDKKEIINITATNVSVKNKISDNSILKTNASINFDSNTQTQENFQDNNTESPNNLLKIILKEQNKSLDEENTKIDRRLHLDPYSYQNRTVSLEIYPSINILSYILKEQNKSLDDYEAQPKITNSAENINIYRSFKNVSQEDLAVNITRKKRTDSSDTNFSTPCNKSDSLINKSTENVTENKALKSNVSKFDGSEFFLMASNFFSSLSGVFFDEAIEKDPLLNLVALLTVSNSSNATSNSTSTNKTKTIDRSIEYPLYDSEMFDNIGHRSRVLLSIEENSNVIDNETERSEDIARTKGGGSTEVFKTETELHHSKDNSTGLTTQTYVTHNSSTKIEENDKNTHSEEEKHNLKANKSLVKRNAPEDSNLIFWNDIYDEEYGIQTDPLENTMRDKNSLPSNDLMKKSGVWIQEKMKRISDSIKKQSRDGLKKIYGSNDKTRRGRGTRGLDMFFNKRDYQKNKDSNFDNELFKEKDSTRINSFPNLSDHMKKVCEEASKAVQMTHGMKSDAASADVRRSEEDMSVNLMQNLVRLLSDLVDYQVRLKTCNKLPQDLHQFLLWLKTPVIDSKDEKADLDDETRAKIIEAISQTQALPTASTPEPRSNTVQITPTTKLNMRMSSLPTPSQAWPTERDEAIRSEERAEYIGALHAVQDLLRQYELMSAEDKNKMAGIKDYLENQLFFLSRQLYPNEYSYSHFYSQNPNQYRIKRDSSTKSKKRAHYKPGRRKYRQRRHNLSNYKLRGKANKFIKSFGKKHTRTTAGTYDKVAVTTEVKTPNVNKKVRVDDIENGFVKRSAGIDKDDAVVRKVTNQRSLLNVYYHAVEEAKKSTTTKNAKRNAHFEK